MTQKPPRTVQITRIPQTPASGPSTARTGPRLTPSSPQGCPRCGAWVWDRAVHDRFHEELAKTSRWVQAVNQILSLLTRSHPEREAFPNLDDTPTAGESTTSDGEGLPNA